MTLGKHLIALLFIALVVIPCSTLVFAQTSSEVAKGAPPTASVDHDGQHDFDSFAGTWKCHTKYRAHPFSGSDTTWIEFDGTETFQKLWDGAMLGGVQSRQRQWTRRPDVVHLQSAESPMVGILRKQQGWQSRAAECGRIQEWAR